MADDAERVKRVTDRVRKHLTGMMLKPSDMNQHDKEDVEAGLGERDVLAPTDAPDTRGAGHAALQTPDSPKDDGRHDGHPADGQGSSAADLAPQGQDEKDGVSDVHMDPNVHISPISKSKHFRSIVDAYRKSK